MKLEHPAIARNIERDERRTILNQVADLAKMNELASYCAPISHYHVSSL
jgi:hypothetical protein